MDRRVGEVSNLVNLVKGTKERDVYVDGERNCVYDYRRET